MAIARMEKIMIVAHRSQAADLLEALQEAGLVQFLDAERAMVSKEWPELQVEIRRPRDLEEMTSRLEKAIAFLKAHAEEPDPTSLFAPRVEIDAGRLTGVAGGREALDLLDQAEQNQKRLITLGTELEQATERIDRLLAWRELSCRLEELKELSSTAVFTGLVPNQNLAALEEALADQAAAMEIVGCTETHKACLILCLHEQAAEVQKILRGADFEAVHLDDMQGTVSQQIEQHRRRLHEIDAQLKEASDRAADLARRRLDLQILFDYTSNLLQRRMAQDSAPATEHTVFLEGWTRRRDYRRVEEIVHRYEACAVTILIPGGDEEPPVEIENGPAVRPFESITRLYGMPAVTDVDPTVFLAPFFALFFGLCMTDAAYGLIMLGFLWWLLRKIKGDKKFVWMMVFCSVTTIIAGALTGGWCGDAIQTFVPQLDGARRAVMWFDPMEKPMHFFAISLGLGYVQIIAGVLIAFVHKMKRGDYRSAVFDHLSWLIWLNSLALFGLSKAGMLPALVGTAAGPIAIVPALMIILFSEREGGTGYRIGMGCYNLFSTVFYIGDILSYIRLMALGISSAGFGMAVNVISKQVMGVPYVGWLLGGILFVGMHLFNVANSALSSFVHSMRLQFVEFFTKFLAGGGKEFDPLRKQYKHITVKE
jgi:V/A-type H+-transporting ATPase subunit I